jgi:hypothetical protein
MKETKRRKSEEKREWKRETVEGTKMDVYERRKWENKIREK